MKKLLTILLMLPLFCLSQSYLMLSAKVNSVQPVVVSMGFGYQFNSNALADFKLHVPLRNGNKDAAYFMAEGGYQILNKDWKAAPTAGLGYKLTSTDNTKLNGVATYYGARISYKWLLINTGWLDKKLLVSVGLIGWWNNE